MKPDEIAEHNRRAQRTGLSALLNLRIVWPWMSPASKKLRGVSNRVVLRRFRGQHE